MTSKAQLWAEGQACMAVVTLNGLRAAAVYCDSQGGPAAPYEMVFWNYAAATNSTWAIAHSDECLLRLATATYLSV